ncbi:MAG: hypothetical protein A2898_01090 [Candidatus Kerfeldbacteria bacterium RIFCSPLOWO2_01_FULL_48_11]|uniref:Type II secretion system protein GspG C-terminal domain-containing protein n=1 Tax=Candidatus Kerfeldbacteria bacterium RIFCSPLOWO2_01_FULL_48_11 TaxID=1798543 RepID=A0A1G2B6B0_9BACT|nr:MAG: hypothetical protein UY34_C0030G0006 [Parcubacteria group bacterium GW2011_GWA2_48_9]KKW16455.1 MAG: hypothetical protein UY52_C0004G0019 [Parcubacteria group bacterium GW2011_GWC2_49_9]OGY84682.1 MAG: hypothetical protein A2898_01090 [Candidatus Kerfeldbacteria bacterium RIFCSPLOWO2_01_FULL_48_11]HCJ52840.1 hypothetical protein [Candidatus Kerfeldbacteria bacterium]HCM68770.1 hypothetical protein [Candidatus Kerfeldbacteria bacterium]
MDINTWILQARGRGLSDDELREQLLTSGWALDQVNQALAHKPLSPREVILQEIETTPEQTVSASPSGEKTHKAFKGLRWALIGGIIAVVAGGGVFAYTKGYLPIPFLTKNAEQLLIESFAKLSEVQSGEFGFTFQVNTENRTVERSTASINQEEPLFRQKAKNAQMQSDAAQIRTGLILYYDDHDSKFPATLDPITPDYLSRDLVQADGTPFVYTPSSDFTSYTLSFTCLGSNSQGMFDSVGDYTGCQPIDDSFSSSDLSYVFDDMLGNIPSDLSIQAAITSFIDVNKEDPTQTSGILTLSGSYEASGLALSIDAEVRMIGGKTYVYISKIPSLLLESLSSIQGKWIVVDNTEISNGYMDFLDFSQMVDQGDSAPSYREELMHMYQIAFREKMLQANIDGKETINGHPTHRIKLEIDFEKLPATIEAYKQDVKNRNVNNEYMDMLEEVGFEEDVTDQLMSLFADTEWTLWVDQAGSTMRKFEVSIIMVPPDENEQLKDKQIRTTFGVTFDHMGEKPKVDIPDETTNYDDLVQEMTGTTVEDEKFREQKDTIVAIRSALSGYYLTNGAYPETLGALLVRPRTNSDIQDNYLWNNANIAPDQYTGEEYQYSSAGSSYELIYTIHLPPPDSNTYDFYSGMFVEGINTATNDYLSKAIEDEKDSDKDGLTDNEEARYGTNKNYRDTDFDGYDDLTEIENGHDPLKAATTTNTVTTQTSDPIVGYAAFWTRDDNWEDVTNKNFINTTDGKNKEYLLIRKSGPNLEIILNDSPATTWSAKANFMPDTWHYVVCVWESEQVPKMYFDGGQLTVFAPAEGSGVVTSNDLAWTTEERMTTYGNRKKTANTEGFATTESVREGTIPPTAQQIREIYLEGYQNESSV